MEQRVSRILFADDFLSAGVTTPNNLATTQLGLYSRNGKLVDEVGADNSIFYCVQGVGNTRLAPIWGSPIYYHHVTTLKLNSYQAPVNQVTTITMPAPLVAGDEYSIRVVYKFNKDYYSNRQETQLFSVYITDAIVLGGAAALATEFETVINAIQTGYAFNEFRMHITPSTAGADLILTGDTEEVRFEVFMWKNIEQAPTGATIVYTTDADQGVGTYNLVREMEDYIHGHLGHMNRTKWPIDTPTFYSTSGVCYDMITIEHHNISTTGSVGVQEYQHNPVSTIIAVDNSAGITAGLFAKLQALIPASTVTPAF